MKDIDENLKKMNAGQGRQDLDKIKESEIEMID